MQGSTVMCQSSAEALVTEEPYALIAHVRVCGGAGWVTTGSTRKRVRRSSKATRGENLQVEHPICGGDASAFHFHPTVARVLGSTLIRYQVVQVGEPRQKRLLAPVGMMKGFHHEQLPVKGVVGLV